MERRKTFIDTTVSNTSSTIKGLQLFIADLRSSQQSDYQTKRIQSEIVKIKQYFNVSTKQNNNSERILGSDKLDGYQRKKYVAKLAYIYITSNTTMLNDISFGLDQTIELTKSNVFSEKFMGYMTLELLYRHKSVVDKINKTLLTQLINDLSGSNDDFTALALNFVGVASGLTKVLATCDELVTEVFQILRSPTSSLYLKKKSTLAFLTLLKSNSLILSNDVQRNQLWIQRILSLLDDTDNYRLALTTLPLVQFIAKNIDPSYCTRLVPQLTDILYKCVAISAPGNSGNNFPEEYKFANMPNPWLITQIVSLLNVLIISPSEVGRETGIFESSLLHTGNIDAETLGKLRSCVMEAINLGTRRTSDPMEKVVQITVLFSLTNFASKLDPSHESIVNSATALCGLLNSNDINVRYLALDSLIKLCSSSDKEAIDTIRGNNLDLIFHILNTERDSSIIRKVIDLLYTFTDVSNVKIIVEQLISFILNSKHISDPHIKSDIAVKAAILTENFSSEPSWFIVISLRILSLAVNTSSKDEQILQRLCQIVVNNPQLHKMASEQLVTYLYSNQVSEYIIKTAAFILGEYGNLIPAKIAIPGLFNLFTDKYFEVSNRTKAMILTTMVKLYKFNPDIGSAVIKFFQLELNSLDIELQTRSYEYLKLIQVSKLNQNFDLLDMVFQSLPPFNSKSNPLLKRLGSLPTGSVSSMVERSRSSSMAIGDISNIPDSSTNATTINSQGSESNPTTPLPPPSRQTRSSSVISSSVLRKPNLQNKYSQLRLSNSWGEGFSRMFRFKQGILFTSPLIKIQYRVDVVDLTKLEISLTYINQTKWDITALSSEIVASRTQDNPEYILQNIQAPGSSTVATHKRVDQKFEVIIRKPFFAKDAPIVNIYFKCGGSSNTLNLKLGVGVTSTLSNNGTVTLAQFVTRWKILSDAMGKEGESQLNNVIFKSQRDSSVENNLETLINIVTRMGFDVIQQNSISNSLFLAGIIHTKTDGNFGCLIKVTCPEAGKFNFTCKSTSRGSLAQNILECIEFALK